MKFPRMIKKAPEVNRRMGTNMDVLMKASEEFETPRPLDMTINCLRSDDGVKIPIYGVTFADMYALSRQSDIWQITTGALKREIFKNGIEFYEKFKMRCDACEKDFEAEPDNNVCDECGGVLRRPKNKEERIVRQLADDNSFVNMSQDSLEVICRQIEDDFNICDSGYILALKDYEIDEYTGEVVGTKVRELLHASPTNIALVMDTTGLPGYTDDGKAVMFCPVHRDKIVYDKEYCPICRTKLFRAYAKANLIMAGSMAGNYSGDKSKEIFYSDGEVFHTVKFGQGKYGNPPLIALWEKLVSMEYMDSGIHKYYYHGHPPHGLLFVNTKNPTGFQKLWSNILNKLKGNPNQIFPIAVDQGPGGSRKIAEFVRFDYSLQEMQWREVRDEFRRICGAYYGVTSVFTGDITPGGVYNEGLQVTVTTRAVEDAQRLYNNRIFPWICRQYGLKDYGLRLLSPESGDIMSELKIQNQRNANAMQLQQMGFELEMTHTGEYRVLNKKPTPPQQDMGGVFGGSNDTGPDVRERNDLQGEPWHNHPTDQTVQGQPDMNGIWAQKSMADELERGIKVEMEHTKDPKTAEQIARDHLTELPDYYTRLLQMESEAKDEINKGRVYVTDPSKVPEGVKVQEGKRGGHYYESTEVPDNNISESKKKPVGKRVSKNEKTAEVINDWANEAANLHNRYDLAKVGEDVAQKVFGGINANEVMYHNYPVDIINDEKKEVYEVKAVSAASVDKKIKTNKTVYKKFDAADELGYKLRTIMVIVGKCCEIYIMDGYRTARPPQMEYVMEVC